MRLARCLSVFQLLHLLQRLLETLQTGPQVHRDQLSDAVSVVIDDVPRGAAAVVAVQRGGTLQTHGEVTRLAEEPELLPRVEGAGDGAAEATARLQLLQTLNGVGRRPLLPPDGGTENTYTLQKKQKNSLIIKNRRQVK